MFEKDNSFVGFSRSKFLIRQSVDVVVEVLGADPTIPVIQFRIYNLVSVVHRNKMPMSSPSLAPTAINHFMRPLALSGRSSRAALVVTDDHRIARGPGLHRDRDP